MKSFLFHFACFLFIIMSAVFSEAAPSTSLNPSEAKQIKSVLLLHQKGKYTQAQKEWQRVQNNVLDGYVLYDKYMSPKYKTSQKEIETWLNKYNDLAVAPEIYALGKRKKMSLKAPKPKEVLYGGKSKACSYIRRDEPIDLLLRRTFSELTGARKKEAYQTYRQFAQYIQKGKTRAARELIESRRFTSLYEAKDLAVARTALAFSYFLDGEFKKSLSYAQEAIETDADATPLSTWTAGLACWQLEKYDQAASYFSDTATHSQIYPLLRAGSSFWAARAYLKTGDYEKVGDYLEVAAQYPRTFYGILATHMLGQNIHGTWQSEEATLSARPSFTHPALTRFYALKKVGKKDWANKELTKLYLESDTTVRQKLMKVSAQNGFRHELIQLAGTTTQDESERFPAPNWNPQQGWKVDKALIYAYVRQESCFNSSAKSAVGARGLMQIMPGTGQVMAKKAGLPWSLAKMDNISYNLALGQSYILHLMSLPAISNNLIYLAVAYNGGPGNLIKWKKQTQYTTDSLMFIESIPSRETRSFVERIMVNYWVYRALLGKSLTTIDDVIAGRWPIYEK